MKVECFEDLLSWKKSQELAKLVYNSFDKCRDFSFRDQITRAVVSISNNIAEGFERRTDGELAHFLFVSKGSCGELRSMLYLARDLGYINLDRFELLYTLSLEISRLLSGFITSLKQ